MAEITAAVVMKLRKMSGQGMMDCKKALAETDGDLDAAMAILRKKGLATMEKRAGRETSEGLVITKASDDGKTVALASLCCETDFVSKSDGFKAAAAQLGDYAMVCTADEGGEALSETEVDGKKFSEIITDTVSKTGEKTQIGDYARFSLDGAGLIAVYIHFNHKVGTMLQIETNNDEVAGSESLKTIANDIAMHITATKPLALDESSIDAETIEKEKAVYAGQVQNKPAEIVEKIITGKLKKFFAENCLMAQPFVKDDSKSVSEVLAEAAKAGGGEAKLTKFVRFEVG